MPAPTCFHASRLVVAACVVATGTAFATAQRTFVSGQGSDANACSITAPCRSFTAAIAQTIVGGEVIVLDSAGYGPVAIAQSVTITAPPGVYAGISVPATTPTGVFVDAPGVIVVLRGLSINSTGGTIGIEFRQGGGLTIERCRVSGFAQTFSAGIVQNSAVSPITVRDTVISDGYSGLTVYGVVTLDGVSIERNAVGVLMHEGNLTMRAGSISGGQRGIAARGGTISLDGVTISHMTISGIDGSNNPLTGSSINVHVVRSQIVGTNDCIFAYATNFGDVQNFYVTDTLLADCANGVVTGGESTAVVSHATIVNNGKGLNSVNGKIYTLQNNEVFVNSMNISGTILPVPYQ